MAEIVRLLRWRAEWDGAGLVDGASKAAAAGERLKKSLDEVGAAGPAALQKTSKAAKETDVAFEGLGLEAQQVEMYLGRLEKGSGSPLVLQRNAELAAAAMSVLSQSAERAGQTIPQAFSERVASAIGAAKTQAAGMNAELEKMGGQTPTKLDKVITALEKTESSAADAWAAIRKMGEEGARAAAALDKMQASANSPRELQRNAAIAELEMQDLRAAIDAARASGVRLGPDVGASLNMAAQSISSAEKRAGQLRDVMGDMTTRGDMAAKGFEAVAGAAGSMQGMLGRLMDTGGQTSQMLAKLGFSVIAFGAAAKMGYAEGVKLREVLTELGVPLPNFSAAVAEAVVDLSQFASSSNQTVTTGTVLYDTFFNLATGTRGMAAGLRELEGPESAAIERARQHLALRESQAKAEQALRTAFAGSGVTWKSGYQELEKLNLALADAELRLSRAAKSQKTWDLEMQANGPTYVMLAQKAEAYGLNLGVLASRVKAVAEDVTLAAEAKKKATEEFAAAAVAALAKAQASYDEVADAARRDSAAAVSGFEAKMRALNSLQVSEEEYSARKKQLYDEMMTAMQTAAASEQAAAEATKRTQAEVQEAIGTTPAKFDEVKKAADAYNAAIEKGATPAAAMATAIESLSTGMFATATAMNDVGTAMNSIRMGDTAVQVETAAEAASRAASNFGDMATGLDSITGAGGRAVSTLNNLAGAFQAVAAAAAAAAGGGGLNQGDPGFVGPPAP